MENLLLLYYFTSLATGIFCLGSLFAIRRSNRNDLIQSFLFCYGFFCLFILVTTLQTYLEILSLNSNNYISFILFATQFFSMFTSMLILTFLINKIHLVPFADKSNRILSFITFLIWIFCILREIKTFAFLSLPFLRFIDDELLHIIIIVYNICIYIFYKKNIKNLDLYKILRNTFFIVLLNVPGFIIDELISSENNRMLIFTSFFFILISIFSLHSFFRYHEATQAEQYNITDDLKSKIGVSDREIEVAQLLLKGYSYQKIADDLIISISTVRTHVTNIYKKAGIKSRYELYNIIHLKDSE